MPRELVREAAFPPSCGVYILYDPASPERPLYVGVAATQTIEQRWRQQHLRSRAGGSALRRSLGVHLGLVDRKLNVKTDGRFYPAEVETAITAYLAGCRIAFVVAVSPAEATQIEHDLIRSLEPVLNVRGRLDQPKAARPVRDTRLVIVGGPPASGKTTLATRLTAHLALPLIAKDGIKEALFESAGVGDRAWSEHLGVASFAVLWHILETQLAAGRDVMVEGNFTPDWALPQLVRLREQYGFVALQLHCTAPRDALEERYRQRLETRHPGHADQERLADIRSKLDPARYLLPLPDELRVVDTTSFDTVDYDTLLGTVRRHLARK